MAHPDLLLAPPDALAGSSPADAPADPPPPAPLARARQASNTAAGATKPLISIVPTSGWAALNLKELWVFRDLFITLAARDIKLRYKQTLLGVAWVILQPLIGAVMFAFVFGILARFNSDGCPYILFAFVGMSAWTLFSATMNRVTSSLVGNASLISKVYFPRLLLPLSSVPSGLLDYGVALVMAWGMMAWYHRIPSWSMLALPLWLILLTALAIGIGLLSAALMVTYRDVGAIVAVIMQLMMWGSPIAYALTNVPARYRAIYMLNPIATIFEGFRWSLLSTGQLDLGHVLYTALVVLVILAVGTYSFKKMEKRFADII